MYYNQRTIRNPAECSGVGVHSGKPATIRILPAQPNHGIKFRRTDLPGQPCIPALFKMVTDTSLATVLGHDGAIVSTIEHLMAALTGLGIDNAVVEIDAYEMPIMDGSASAFVDIINKAGIEKQDARRCFFIITSPVEVEEDGKFAGVYPDDKFRISCTIEYDDKVVGRQEHTITLEEGEFEKVVSGARTFGYYHEYEFLKKQGLARGGSLDNAVVIDGDKILNEGGLRYDNEFVRHKMLDSVGDFSLLGMPLLGHIKTFKSGHLFNHKLLQKIFAQKECWKTGFIDEAASSSAPDRSKSLAV